ncbi:hypothetical protein [Nocardia wallacei]|nr:hypothetical protein [Nocardia wallacei]
MRRSFDPADTIGGRTTEEDGLDRVQLLSDVGRETATFIASL